MAYPTSTILDREEVVRLGRTFDGAPEELAAAQGRLEFRRSLDASYRTVRCRCDDGTLSYPIAFSYDDAPLAHADCVSLVARFIRDGLADSRVPKCPDKPAPGRRAGFSENPGKSA